ncbi:MAG: TonB family protein [Thermoanaerobaculia bacterium]
MFEDALIESGSDTAHAKRALSWPVSLALHVVLIGGALGASIWFVEDVPEPPIPVAFYASSPPPPPPPPAAPKAAPKAPDTPKPVIRPTEMVQPQVIPESIPQPLAEPEAPDDPGVAGGVPGGVVGGVPGGVLGGTGPAGDGEILRVGGEVKAPVLLQRIDPTYPEAARKARMEGVVILEAIITATGSVEEVRVLKSVNPLLDASAVRAVQQWRYRPATLNGRAVRVYLTVTATFNLH